MRSISSRLQGPSNSPNRSIPRYPAVTRPGPGGRRVCYRYRPRSLAESTAWLRPPATFVVLYEYMPLPSLSSPLLLSHSPTRFSVQKPAKLPSPRKAKKKLSPLIRSPLPRPSQSGGAGADSFRQAGATWCGGLFPRFCATAGLNCPPRLPWQGHQEARLNKTELPRFRWFSPCLVEFRRERSSRLFFPFFGVASCAVAWLRKSLLLCLVWCSLVGHASSRLFKHCFCVFDRSTPPVLTQDQSLDCLIVSG